MRYAIIENDVVVNVVVGDEHYSSGVQSDSAGVGDSYINGEFVKPAPPEPTEEELAKVKAEADYNAALTAVKTNPAVISLAEQDPAHLSTWVNLNVLTLDDAKDLLAPLAAAVSILARKL